MEKIALSVSVPLCSSIIGREFQGCADVAQMPTTVIC